MLDFPAEAGPCPRCGGPQGVLKTRRRRILTLAHGEFVSRETVRGCSSGPPCTTHGSHRLAALVPSGQRYGYDLIVWVALRRYRDRRQRREIQAELAREHGLSLSTGTLSALCDRFVRRLAALHRLRSPALRAAMPHGYSLHLDGTYQGGESWLFVTFDAWRGWVLTAGHLDRERNEAIRPILDETRALFGDPLAVVRDHAGAIQSAVEPLRQQGIPDFVCHYHVLSNLGTKLLKQGRAHLRRVLRRSSPRARLTDLLRQLQAPGPSRSRREEVALVVLWLLRGEGKAPADFPFALSELELLERAAGAPERLELWVSSRGRLAAAPELRALESLLAELDAETDLPPLRQELTDRRRVFQEVRDVLRLADPSKPPTAHLPEIELILRGEIQEAFDRYFRTLEPRIGSARSSLQKALRTVRKHLKPLQPFLFGHPAVHDSQGQLLYVVERTNNALEHFFSSHHQSLRRRTGRKHLGRDLDQLPAHATLIHNLHDPLYVEILCGSLDQLPAALANLPPDALDSKPLRPSPHLPLQRRLRSLCRTHSLPPQPPPLALSATKF